MSELHIGDRILMEFGPYNAVCTVVEITLRGAVLKLSDIATLEPARTRNVTSKDGTVLSAAPYTFLGRAHWRSTDVLPAKDGL